MMIDNSSDLRLAIKSALFSQDWSSVADMAMSLRQTDPESGDGYFFGAVALRRLGQGQTAGELIAEGLARFPDHRRLLAIRYSGRAGRGDARQDRRDGEDKPATAAEMAPSLEDLRREVRGLQAKQDWKTLRVAAARLCRLAPDDVMGYRAQSLALRKLRLNRQTESFAASALARFPDDFHLLCERGKALHNLKQPEAALACFRRLPELAPDEKEGWNRLGGALMFLGRFDEAEAVLANALARFPDNPGLLGLQIICARRRLDLDLAKARLAHLETIVPGGRITQNLRASLIMAEAAIHNTDGVSAPASVEKNEPAGSDGLDDGSVLKHFESIGANCEFGLVQRTAGIEPLSLLRFSLTKEESLAEMLENEFAGIGQPESMTLELTRSREYLLRFGEKFHTHTFINFGAEPEDALMVKFSKRTLFLKDKLLRDLREGKKIFLYHAPNEPPSEDMIRRLHAAIRGKGTSRFVCAVHDDARAFGVTALDDGLFVANMPGRFEQDNLRAVGTPQYETRYRAWLTLCRSVLAHEA